jgi:hypothetical protein
MKSILNPRLTRFGLRIKGRRSVAVLGASILSLGVLSLATPSGATGPTSLVLGAATTTTDAGQYVTPTNTCSVLIQAKGGNGGAGWTGSDNEGGTDEGGAGGVGGYIDSIFPASEGATLAVSIGQPGTSGSRTTSTRSAGGTGSGTGGTSGLDTFVNNVTAGGGGGSSEVTDNGTPFAVAGGGGGGATIADGLSNESAGMVPGGAGGQGANTVGGAGGGVSADTFASGGTLSAPGTGGIFVQVPVYNLSGTNGTNGSGTNGGNGGDGVAVAGGGGGGGYFGGGGGPGSGSGAGGSSFAASGAQPDTITSWTSPSSQAVGEVILTAIACPPPVTTTQPPTPPGSLPVSPPTDLVVTGGRGKISASWSMPTYGATSYECVLTRRDATIATTTRTPYVVNTTYKCTFTGLKGPAIYGVGVNASNAAGSSSYVTDYAKVSSNRSTLLCVKGKHRMRVAGSPPRCPAGYRP